MNIFSWFIERRILSLVCTGSHLVEYAKELNRVKTMALARTGSLSNPVLFVTSPGPPTMFMTSAGIRMMYALRSKEGRSYEHCLSISYKTGILPVAVAKFLISYSLYLLELGNISVRLSRHGRTTYHLAFELDRKSNRIYANNKILIPDPNRVESLISTLRIKQNKIEFKVRKPL